MYSFFFFQAEDGIRDKLVTGVQTCALPICSRSHFCPWPQVARWTGKGSKTEAENFVCARPNRSEDEDDLDLAPGETELVRQMCRRIDRRELLSVGDAGEERDEESRRVLLGPGEGALPDRGRQLVPRAHHQGDVEPEFAGKGSLDLLHELAWFFSLVVKTALPVCRSVATSL